jgi:release factor glutamine methyltransferase
MRQAFAAEGGETVGILLARAAATLAAAAVETSRLDSRLLLSHATGEPVERLVAWPERPVSNREAQAFAALVQRRVGREPLAQIVGCREFWSLPFFTTRDTLTPRPDSEAVLEAVLRLFPDRKSPLRILDLGTGTGCLLLALLSEYPAATGIGTDISDAAARVAALNAKTLGYADRSTIVISAWDDAVDGAFDVIVSNPPYIATAELDRLAPEIERFEPRLALDGGPDGLDVYRVLAPRLYRRLRPGGHAVLEVGFGQAGAVESILLGAGLATRGRQRDLSGADRCTIVQR